MHSQRGNGKGLVVVALAASAFIATAANADMVSFTTVVTNNTNQEKVYDFSKIIALSVGGNLGVLAHSPLQLRIFEAAARTSRVLMQIQSTRVSSIPTA